MARRIPLSNPLDGILVITLEHAVAAPLCSSRLADVGARVIKIERPNSGDFARHYDTAVKGQSSYFVWNNRGKESLELDIKCEDDLALMHRMLDKADVFIQNLAPGAAERAGLGATQLRNKYPELIVCEISGYGSTGPYRHMKAYDLLVQAETGLVSITGTPDSPGRVGVSVCDIAAGMNALSGILLALIERNRTGKGQHIQVSLFDGMADWMSVPLLHHDYAGRSPERVGVSHPSIAPYDVFKTKDENNIVISIQNDQEWKVFCTRILETPELSDHPDFSTNNLRVINRTKLNSIISGVFSENDMSTMTEKLLKARIAFGRLNSIDDLSRHPQLRRCKTMTEKGEIELVAPPARISEDLQNFRPVPALGEHNEILRKEFGKA